MSYNYGAFKLFCETYKYFLRILQTRDIIFYTLIGGVGSEGLVLIFLKSFPDIPMRAWKIIYWVCKIQIQSELDGRIIFIP